MARARARAWRDRAFRSVGAARAGTVAFFRRGAPHLLRGRRLERAWHQGRAMGAHPVGHHRRPCAGGAAAFRTGLDRRTARQCRGDSARLGGDHAARAHRRCRAGGRAAAPLRLARAVAARVPRVVRRAARGAVAAARAPRLGRRRRGCGCGVGTRAARHTVARERLRADGAGVLPHAPRSGRGRGVDHDVRRRSGPRGARAHGEP